MSDDTWLEFYTVDNFGIDSMKFLGQGEKGDAYAQYYSTSTCREWFNQLLRWESGFQTLMKTFPELWHACNLCNRTELPDSTLMQLIYIKENYPEIPLSPKYAMFLLRELIMKLSRIDYISNKYGNNRSWVPPVSDRTNI